MLTAKEAREKANRVIEESLRDLFEDIEKASSEGQYEVTLYTALTDTQISFLKNIKGFKVSEEPYSSCGNDYANYTISWKEENKQEKENE